MIDKAQICSELSRKGSDLKQRRHTEMKTSMPDFLPAFDTVWAQGRRQWLIAEAAY